MHYTFTFPRSIRTISWIKDQGTKRHCFKEKISRFIDTIILIISIYAQDCDDVTYIQLAR